MKRKKVEKKFAKEKSAGKFQDQEGETVCNHI